MPRAYTMVVATVLCAVATASYSNAVGFDALQFAKVAYCPASNIRTWTCASCGYHSNVSDVHVFTNTTWDTQGYVLHHPPTNRIIVAFRGSYNIKNWIADFNFFKRPYPLCDNRCEVHRGFYDTWQDMEGGVRALVRSLHAAHRGSSVLVTGHSLGAAMSLLGGVALVQLDGIGAVTVVNFGEPRVGDEAFATFAAGVLPNRSQFRVTHEADPVPHLPPMAFGFLHTPHELWYDNNGASQFKSCDDDGRHEDASCSDSTVPIDIFDHLYYLGVCALCSCELSDVEAVGLTSDEATVMRAREERGFDDSAPRIR